MEDYYLFIDESGDHGLTEVDPGFPVFVLAGVLISESNYKNLVEAFDRIKQKYWGEKKVIFHSRDIRKMNNEFSILFNPEIKSQFLEDLNYEIANSNFL